MSTCGASLEATWVDMRIAIGLKGEVGTCARPTGVLQPRAAAMTRTKAKDMAG